jgi:hypothetical protein
LKRSSLETIGQKDRKLVERSILADENKPLSPAAKQLMNEWYTASMEELKATTAWQEVARRELGAGVSNLGPCAHEVIERSERGEDVDPEIVEMARHFLTAVEKVQKARKTFANELAYSNAEMLDDLNRGLSEI